MGNSAGGAVAGRLATSAVMLVVTVVLLGLFVPSLARAEPGEVTAAATGVIEGILINGHNDNPIVGLQLRAVNVATGAQATVTTGLEGAFRFTGLDDSQGYRMETTLDGVEYQSDSVHYPPVALRLRLMLVFDDVEGPVFRDVRHDHPFATDIIWMSERGVTSGWPDNTFRPNLPVTRQAAAAFLYRLAGEPPVSGTAGFRDVPLGHEFHDAITWMVQRGITSGWPDNTFRPTRVVTRQAAAAFFHRYDGAPTTWSSAGFRDVPVSHDFHNEIAWMVERGLTTGWPDSTFRPTQDVTRQSMAAFTYRYAGGDGRG